MLKQLITIALVILALLDVLYAQEEGQFYTMDQAFETPELVRHLDLSFMGLTTVPEEVLDFINLESINLTGNELSALPTELAGLPKLKRLTLNGNLKMAVIPLFQNLSKFPRLQSLSLANCNLRILDTHLSKMHTLKELDISGNDLISLTEELKFLDNLEKLNLADNALSSVEALPARLKWLDLSFNPELVNPSTMIKLAGMPFLDSLVLKGTMEIPLEILLLSQISFLDLSDGLFRTFPPKLSNWKHLKSLRIDNCSRLNWSMAVRQLATARKLEELTITDNNRVQLPLGLPGIKRLKKLKLSGAKWQTLPFDLHKCRKLAEITFVKTGQLDLEAVIGQVGLMRRVKKLAVINSAFETLPTNLHFLNHLEYFDLSGNLLDPGLERLLETVLPTCTIIFDKRDVESVDKGNLLAEYNLPWEEFQFSSKNGAQLRLTSGTTLWIPPNTLSFSDQNYADRMVKIRVQAIFDPLAALLSGLHNVDSLTGEPYLMQFAGFFKLEFPEFSMQDQPEFMQSINLEWSSNDAHMHLDVFKKQPVSNWGFSGQDELVLNPVKTPFVSDMDMGMIPDIPDLPVTPRQPVSEKVGVQLLEKKKNLVFEILAVDPPASPTPDDGESPPLKSFTELESLKYIAWKYDGTAIADDRKVLEGLDVRLSNITDDLSPLATDFIIIPDPENDNYRMYFETATGKLDFPVYPLFEYEDLTVSDPLKDQVLNRELYRNYYAAYNNKRRNWELIDAEYQLKLAAHQKAVEAFREEMDGLASLVAPGSSDNIQNTGQYRRKLKVDSPGTYWVGGRRQVIGQEFHLTFIDSQGNPLFPEKVYILDQTNQIVMVFPDHRVQFDTKADNTIIVLLRDGSYGYALKSDLRNMPLFHLSERQVIELDVLPAKAISPERIKNLWLNQ